MKIASVWHVIFIFGREISVFRWKNTTYFGGKYCFCGKKMRRHLLEGGTFELQTIWTMLCLSFPNSVQSEKQTENCIDQCNCVIIITAFLLTPVCSQTTKLTKHLYSSPLIG